MKEVDVLMRRVSKVKAEIVNANELSTRCFRRARKLRKARKEELKAFRKHMGEEFEGFPELSKEFWQVPQSVTSSEDTWIACRGSRGIKKPKALFAFAARMVVRTKMRGVKY